MKLNHENLPAGNLTEGKKRADAAQNGLRAVECWIDEAFGFFKKKTAIMIVLSILAAMIVGSSYRYGVQVRTVREQQAEDVAHATSARLPRPTSIPVPKGTVYTVQRSMFVDADFLPGMKVSIDGGEWIPTREKLYLNEYVRTLRFYSDETDFHVTVLAPAD